MKIELIRMNCPDQYGSFKRGQGWGEGKIRKIVLLNLSIMEKRINIIDKKMYGN